MSRTLAWSIGALGVLAVIVAGTIVFARRAGHDSQALVNTDRNQPTADRTSAPSAHHPAEGVNLAVGAPIVAEGWRLLIPGGAFLRTNPNDKLPPPGGIVEGIVIDRNPDRGTLETPFMRLIPPQQTNWLYEVRPTGSENINPRSSRDSAGFLRFDVEKNALKALALRTDRGVLFTSDTTLDSNAGITWLDQAAEIVNAQGMIVLTNRTQPPANSPAPSVKSPGVVKNTAAARDSVVAGRWTGTTTNNKLWLRISFEVTSGGSEIVGVNYRIGDEGDGDDKLKVTWPSTARTNINPDGSFRLILSDNKFIEGRFISGVSAQGRISDSVREVKCLDGVFRSPPTEWHASRE